MAYKYITVSGKETGSIGQGTWYLGENHRTFAQECDALCAGVNAGMTLIDTAEMYGDGKAEKLVGEVIGNFNRENLYIVSKVYPFNAGRRNIFKSCEASLRRMGTDYMDMYLLHWRGSVPLRETAECMEELREKRLIRHWGVSNLDTADMLELLKTSEGKKCEIDQVLYNLGSRGPEYDLIPLLRKQGMGIMAYSPIGQAGALNRRLYSDDTVLSISQNRGITVSQLLLAYLLTKDSVMPIPRTSKSSHAVENAGAMNITLTEQEISALDRAFPAPTRKVPLDMI